MEFLRICFGCCLGVRKKGHADVRDAAIEVRANRDWMMSPVHYNMILTQQPGEEECLLASTNSDIVEQQHCVFPKHVVDELLNSLRRYECVYENDDELTMTTVIY